MTGLRLPHGSHVRRDSDVRRVFDRGRSSASADVVVYAFDRADGQPPRFGLVVGRKWGDAVRRNRARRLLRESFRTARPTLPVGFDFLLLPRGRIHGRKMEAVREMLVRAAHGAARRYAVECAKAVVVPVIPATTAASVAPAAPPESVETRCGENPAGAPAT
ncbi:MAG: ribonuclease P protein component [Planctomycetes bacterium]|nr:ribonuclease P protein component [Planctomycetota bacterium]